MDVNQVAVGMRVVCSGNSVFGHPCEGLSGVIHDLPDEDGDVAVLLDEMTSAVLLKPWQISVSAAASAPKGAAAERVIALLLHTGKLQQSDVDAARLLLGDAA